LVIIPNTIDLRREVAAANVDIVAQQIVETEAWGVVWRGDLDEKFPSIRMRTDRRGFQVVPALIDAGKRYSQV
jgi:hypothetical protein